MRCLLILSWVVCCFTLSASAQAEKLLKEQYLPILHEKYTELELKEIKEKEPQKMNLLIYYYGKSFLIENLDCNNCLRKDPRTIDISRYEAHRKVHQRWVHDFEKWGLRLTLLAIDELEMLTLQQKTRLEYEE